MNNKLILMLCLLFILGCETAHDVAYEGGTHIGKTTRAVGGITEGAAAGHAGEVTEEENPMGR